MRYRYVAHFVVQIFPVRDDFAHLIRLCIDGIPTTEKERLMMKRVLALLMTLILTVTGFTALADTPTPQSQIGRASCRERV